MARKDDILISFLKHKMIVEKYGLSPDSVPNTMIEALNSSVPIVKAIALIVDNLESHQSITDSALRNMITQFLREAAL